MGVSSTGENVTLLSVRTEIRGGYGSWFRYKIGGEVVDTGIACPNECTLRGYFTDQGTGYPQSAATKKILSIACAYERGIINSRQESLGDYNRNIATPALLLAVVSVYTRISTYLHPAAVAS